MGPTKVLISLLLVHMVKETITWGNNTQTYVEINRPTADTVFNTGSIQSAVPELTTIGSNMANQKTIDAHQNGSMRTKHANNIRTGGGRQFTSKASDLRSNPRFQKIASVNKALRIANLIIAILGRYYFTLRK